MQQKQRTDQRGCDDDVVIPQLPLHVWHVQCKSKRDSASKAGKPHHKLHLPGDLSLSAEVCQPTGETTTFHNVNIVVRVLT